MASLYDTQCTMNKLEKIIEFAKSLTAEQQDSLADDLVALMRKRNTSLRLSAAEIADVQAALAQKNPTLPVKPRFWPPWESAFRETRLVSRSSFLLKPPYTHSVIHPPSSYRRKPVSR